MKNNSGHWIEGLFWVITWIVETLLIKFWIGVDSWLIAIFLSITVGSFLVWVVKHVPDLLE